MPLRIIAGELRGRRLATVPGLKTRPTADRTRESVFNILGPTLDGLHVLDLFAGTGAFGIEALSRGAASCVFVESERSAARILAGNLEALGIRSGARLVVQPFERATAHLGAAGGPFDIVFLDPPYGPGDLFRAIRLADQRRLLASGGILIAEHDLELPMPEREGSLACSRTARYGGTCLTFYESQVDSEGDRS